MWSRMHLIPLLMAEADRRDFRGQQLQHAVETALMHDVPGWQVSAATLCCFPADFLHRDRRGKASTTMQSIALYRR